MEGRYRDSRGSGQGHNDAVRHFIHQLYNAILGSKVDEMRKLYRDNYQHITHNYFQESPWPEAEQIAELVDDDPSFILLYRELYYRHIFGVLHGGTDRSANAAVHALEQKIQSWYAYCDLFDAVLQSHGDFEVEILPEQWVWDITSEFVYQFQSFCQYRSDVSKLSPEEIEILKDRDGQDAWSTPLVLRYLHRLIGKSRIKEILAAEKAGQVPPSAPSELLRLLGYFSIISMNRAQVLLCDYHSALQMLDYITFGQGALYTRSGTCHVTMYYHMGVAQVMSRRYVDAIQTFTHILVHINRSKQYYLRFRQVQKLADKMLALLAIMTTLCPGKRVDEQVMNLMRETLGDKLTMIQRGDELAFQDLFANACPKFVSPMPMSYDDVPNPEMNALNLQISQFMKEVRQQLQLPTLRSYLKLYRTISLSKLARFRDTDEETLTTQLVSYKHKMYQLQLEKNSFAPSKGKLCSSLFLTYYLIHNMIKIERLKVEQRHGHWFMSHIRRFADIADNFSRDA